MQKRKRNRADTAPQNTQGARGKRRRKRFGLLGALLFCLLFAYDANNRISVTEYTYENSDIPASFDGYRIVQLSDLHNKIFGKENAPLLKKVRELHPDLIVLTGDFIDASNHTDIDAALLFMRQITELAPVYYIYGNHEVSLSRSTRSDFEEQIAAYGVYFMSDESVSIVSETGEQFTLIGLDDRSLQDNTLRTLTEDDTNAFQILLAHEPQCLSDYAQTGVDLVFSGHAHGGQFRIPFTGQGIYAPDQGLLPSMTEGVHRSGETEMIISRGLGNSAFPLRLFNRPEIVCCTLSANG